MSEFSAYGMWWHPARPDVKVAGQLSWALGVRPTLAVLDPPPALWSDVDSSGGVEIDQLRAPMLHGQAAGHGYISLLGCRFGGMAIGATHTHTLEIAEVLTGVLLDEPDEPYFRRARVVLPTLRSILGQEPVSSTMTRGRRRVVLTVDRQQFVWKTGEVTVEWRYQPSFTEGDGQFGVAVVPEMHLSSSRPQSVQFWAHQWIDPIVQLLDVLTGRRSNASAVTLWHKKKMSPLEELSTGIELNALAVADFEQPSVFVRPVARVDELTRCAGGLPEVVSRFVDLQDRQAVFLELLASTIRDADRPVRNRYLDLTAALEAFDSQKSGVGPVSQDTFQERRRLVLRAVAASGLSDGDRRFVKAWVVRRSTFSLEHRLRRLHRSVGSAPAWDVDYARMARLRNDLAHGVARVDRHELTTANDQAFSLGSSAE